MTDMFRGNRIVVPLLTTLAVAFALVTPGATRGDEKKELLIPMFQGQTLNGWHKFGNADWKWVGETLVGSTTSGKGYLVFDRVMGDFILEAEANIPEGANSGILFRADEDAKDGDVLGYQAEIDSTRQRRSGSVYDSQRGWLADGEPDPKKDAFRDGLWNHIRIEAVGAHIRTYVNRQLVDDIYDAERLSGHIAIQHDGNYNKTYRFRNIKYWKMPIEHWKPLFNGKDLKGWQELPGGSWRVNDGVLVGLSDKSEAQHGMLLSDASYADFTVRVVYKSVRGNSGFYFRAEPTNDAVAVKGLQAEIDPEKDTGGLYETGGRAWVVKPDAKDVEKWYRPDAWNTMIVSAYEGRVVVHVNGYKTAEVTNDPGASVGHFGLQLHGGMDMHVEFKNIDILSKNP
ncbi:MAG: DUF1080 domain-containing protein [Phycisphaera sp.]|nr:DUF1080 domain-containing protein [Phycisphaera sp.]